MMRKATLSDKDLVVKILSESFINDPHMNYLFEKDIIQNHLKLLVEFAFDETIRKGEVYINDSNVAVAMWNFEHKEKMSMNYITRHFKLLVNMSPKTIIRLLKVSNETKKLYTNNKTYAYLYFLGVLKNEQGKGFAKQLVTPMLDKMARQNIPVFLETANETNVSIYQKMGFEVFHTSLKENIVLYSMQINPI